MKPDWFNFLAGILVIFVGLRMMRNPERLWRKSYDYKLRGVEYDLNIRWGLFLGALFLVVIGIFSVFWFLSEAL